MNERSNYIKFEKITVNDDFDNLETECSICFYKLENNIDDLIILECGHTFHFNCITTWYNNPDSNFRCPECNIQKNVKEIVYSKKTLEIEATKNAKKRCLKYRCLIC